MDFVERILHISPDGGSGAVELALLMIVVAIPAIRVWRTRRRDPSRRV